MTDPLNMEGVEKAYAAAQGPVDYHISPPDPYNYIERNRREWVISDIATNEVIWYGEDAGIAAAVAAGLDKSNAMLDYIRGKRKTRPNFTPGM